MNHSEGLTRAAAAERRGGRSSRRTLVAGPEGAGPVSAGLSGIRGVIAPCSYSLRSESESCTGDGGREVKAFGDLAPYFLIDDLH